MNENLTPSPSGVNATFNDFMVIDACSFRSYDQITLVESASHFPGHVLMIHELTVQSSRAWKW